MKYELEKKNGEYLAHISTDKDEFDKAVNNAYEKNKGKFNIAGFRKGHAPKSVIEKTYGTGVFMEDAVNELYYNAYTLILKEHEDIQPISSPSLDIKKMDDTGFEFDLVIPVVPEFELANYKGNTFKKQAVKIEDKEVDEAIERELLRASRLVETKEAVKDKDFVILDFDGYVDGKQFPGGKADNYQLHIGSHTFIDTFEEQLIGLNVGDKKDVVVTFPAEYHEKSLAGKQATFKCEIKNIRSRVMPELNDEFVSNSTDFETVDEYKANIKEKLVKDAEHRAEIELDNDMLDRVVDDTDVVPPAVMVEEEFNRQLNGMTQQFAYQGLKLEDYAQYIGKTVDEIKEDIRKQATRNVKGRLVLEKLIRTENLDITKEDIDNKIAEMAKNVGKSLEDFKKEVNNDMVNSIANELLMKKLVDFLHANNEIK